MSARRIASSAGRARRRGLLRAALGLLALLAGGCDAGPSAARAGATEAAPERALVVFAAASLREAFTALGEELARAHPGVELTFNFAGSQELRTQLEHGAAADVFAAADPRPMGALVREGLVAAPVVFARNEPVIVVAPEAAELVRGFADLPRAERIVVGAPEVPIGRYTLEVLERAERRFGGELRARVEARVVSRELSVRQVLTKVRLGEAQAGIVYRTDAQAAPELLVVELPPELAVVAEYPIAVMSEAAHPELARAWVELVRSEAGQAALRAAGFSPPAAGG